MANLKTQFSELRQTTPKYIQWLLLAAAFIVVLILLTLLLRGDKKDNVADVAGAIAPVLTIDPDSLDWSNTRVGETQTQRFTVSANTGIKIDDVRLSKAIAGLGEPKTTCKNIGQINEKLPCTIILEYAPVAAQEVSALSVFIDWRGANQPEKMNKTEKIAIAIGATDTVAQPDLPPSPFIEPPHDIKPQIKQEIEELTQSDPFEVIEPEIKPEPIEPVVAPVAAAPKTSAENCSDFAFPGYGNSGQQIGWIKPDRGTYKFHPFADKNCNSPTGIYNPDNGIITDINTPGKKIGTDAEHIGFGTMGTVAMPQLSNPAPIRHQNKALQLDTASLTPSGSITRVFTAPAPENLMTSSGNFVASSQPYDRTFVLRQYKPIPATIVSEVRADPKTLHARGLPVRATVDRNVYSDNGRTIIIPTGTMLLGYVTGEMPGPYKAIGRMQIEWYQFIRPDGVEFNFAGENPFSADSQGRVGVPGHGSTDYMEQFVMPMLTAIVPAAVNMIAPISDKFVNQIDLDNNTVTQTGEVKSSELAKNEIITAWNKVAQKLLVDMMDNTVPPFSIAAGTRITVFSPMDLLVTCGAPGTSDKKCAIEPYGTTPRVTKAHDAKPDYSDGSWVGQVRSFNLEQYCDGRGGVKPGSEAAIHAANMDYRTVLFYCQSSQYTAVNNAKQAAVFQNQQQTGVAAQGMITGVDAKTGAALGSKEYNEQVLGLKYDETGKIKNPFEKPAAPVVPVLTCEDGTAPDANGCCTGETYTDMQDQGFNCCPAGGGDCFPPII